MSQQGLICLAQGHNAVSSLRLKHSTTAPQVFWGSGENGYLFSGSWGALVIILGELGNKLIIFGI